MTRALTMFSGGKDSTVALAWAARTYDEVHGLSFDVPYRPLGEKRAANAIAVSLGICLKEVALPFMRDVASVTKNSVPQETASAYVPYRNLIFHSIGCHVARLQGCGVVVAGHIASDGTAYADARVDYLAQIYELVRRAGIDDGFLWDPNDVDIELRLPLAGMSDREVIELGRQINAPLDLSWSCLEDGEAPCGECVSCRDRTKAFGQT